MKQYRIPLIWQMYGHVDIEAESLQEAVEIALGPEVPLPDGEYLDESVEVDHEVLKMDYGDEYDDQSVQPDREGCKVEHAE